MGLLLIKSSYGDIEHMSIAIYEGHSRIRILPQYTDEKRNFLVPVFAISPFYLAQNSDVSTNALLKDLSSSVSLTLRAFEQLYRRGGKIYAPPEDVQGEIAEHLWDRLYAPYVSASSRL